MKALDWEWLGDTIARFAKSSICILTAVLVGVMAILGQLTLLAYYTEGSAWDWLQFGIMLIIVVFNAGIVIDWTRRRFHSFSL